ncbi:phosphonate degradation HD-domain oxygenase [Pseudomonas sp. M30-35]|uniref:phosphonate degradation HD-domain oxygenase n=1 Tax=Pseudomonas sp. M30-35 TaxID=1981174 RepID=UPI000B3D1D5F|nr:phosphonate degradation HD-domain oxygenase [Pseudomonas sp. M30-35]ARU88983.1 phosphohydrolase [Pseudomonas sp. M30-35]
MTLSLTQFTKQLSALFSNRGNLPYGEDISQIQHALQCATFAERSGCRNSLIVAALLHDVGHLLDDPESGLNEDMRHEERGAELLRALFADSVWQPIRLHVAAKRYLCAVDPLYHAGLSDTSRHSLQLQGGPFNDREIEAFLRAPYAQDALTLRRLDDLGKDPQMKTPSLEYFYPHIEKALLAAD